MRKKKLPTCYNKIFPLLLLFATFFMGLAYASINSTDLSILASATMTGKDGLFISGLTLNSNSGSDISFNRTEAYNTVLDSTIALSETDGGSFVTYNISIFNNYDLDFTFMDVVYDSSFYDNSNIVFYLEGLDVGDSISSKEEITFQITFKYKDGVVPEDGNNILNSYINFRFLHPVTYIESTGEQYIDTGITPDSTTTFDMTFAFHTVHEHQAIIGSRTNMESNDFFNLFLHNLPDMDNLQLRWDQGLTTGDYINLPVNEWKKINVVKETDKITLTSNGQTIEQAVSDDNSNYSNNIYVFSQNQFDSVETRNAKIKFYYLKMYKGGQLVRDFIPVLDQNSTPCLYDRVSNSYFYNLGTGSFGYSMYNNIYDYLESSGTQYIDTEIKADENTEVQFVMAMNDNYTSTQSIFGARDDMNTNLYNMFWYNSSLRWDYYANRNFISGVNPTSPTHVIANASGVTVNGVKTSYNYTDTFSTNYNMFLFSVNDGGNPIYLNSGLKLYYFKILQNDEVVRNYIPATNPDGVACLYDLVSQSFNCGVDSTDVTFNIAN